MTTERLLHSAHSTTSSGARPVPLSDLQHDNITLAALGPFHDFHRRQISASVVPAA
ncbi:hypothetical protein DPMN_014564 [Dreissena polymorpha]|uniref:Uncharacterized protein n=1 Tax=Dreissena polymorpha TaxID=45954 RepID=A0A9D4N689_DREPO|nr:hypothetical protein DPMN_014564 [Dreissena polymorpha]